MLRSTETEPKTLPPQRTQKDARSVARPPSGWENHDSRAKHAESAKGRRTTEEGPEAVGRSRRWPTASLLACDLSLVTHYEPEAGRTRGVPPFLRLSLFFAATFPPFFRPSPPGGRTLAANTCDVPRIFQTQNAGPGTLPRVPRGGSGQWRVVPVSSLGASASDLSVPFERKISGRLCVGGDPGRAAHPRRGTGGLE